MWICMKYLPGLKDKSSSMLLMPSKWLMSGKKCCLSQLMLRLLDLSWSTNQCRIYNWKTVLMYRWTKRIKKFPKISVIKNLLCFTKGKCLKSLPNGSFLNGVKNLLHSLRRIFVYLKMEKSRKKILKNLNWNKVFKSFRAIFNYQDKLFRL